MILKPMTLAALAFTLTACASADMESKDTAENGKVKMVNGVEKVCKRERKTGTRFYEEVCYTEAELEQQREDARAEADRYDRRTGQAAPSEASGF